MARFRWRMVYISFKISPLMNINHIFDGSLLGVDRNLRMDILVGTWTLCWPIWVSRNDVVLRTLRLLLQCRRFRGSNSIRFWALLKKRKIVNK